MYVMRFSTNSIFLAFMVDTLIAFSSTFDIQMYVLIQYYYGEYTENPLRNFVWNYSTRIR